MKPRIKLSETQGLGFDFNTAVAAYRAALQEFAARPAEWAPIPAPIAPHPLIAVAASFDAFEIVDDSPPPPPPPSIEQQKELLANAIMRATDKAEQAIIPKLKRPLMDLAVAQAAKTPIGGRTLAQREAMHNRRGMQRRLEAVQLHGAALLAEIADLTEETLPAWRARPFPVALASADALSARKEALAEDVDEMATAAKRRLLPPYRRALMSAELRQINRVPADQHSEAQKQTLARYQALQDLASQVDVHAALLKDEIEGLTDATIEAWRPAAFPGQDPQATP